MSLRGASPPGDEYDIPDSEEDEGEGSDSEEDEDIADELLDCIASAGNYIKEEDLIATWMERSPSVMERIQTMEELQHLQESVHNIIDWLIEMGVIKVAMESMDPLRPEKRFLQQGRGPPC